MRRLNQTVLVVFFSLAACAFGEEINLRKTTTVEVVQKTKDAVVNISTTKLVARRVGGDPFWLDMGQVVKVPANSLGSGFIIHRDGYVVTNHHVIDRARQITVELADGRKLPADLVSSDPDADLALLKITDKNPFPTLELGDTSDLMIGEPVIAVGNPLGFSHSVSTGIVSALHRDLKDQNSKVMLGDLVQTDAAINPGNSGGPLLNAYGQVIGINTAIRGDAQNIGFAIPVNRLHDLIPELMNPLHVAKVQIPLKLVEKRKLTPPAKIEASCELTGDKPAVVTKINGQPIAGIVDAYAILLGVRAEQKQVELELADGSKRKFDIQPAPVSSVVAEANKRLGIAVEAVTPLVAEKMHLATEDGLLLSSVARDSVAAKAGLQAGDIIVQLGRYRISSLSDLDVVLQHLPATGRVRVGVVRGDQVAVGVIELK